MEEEKKALEQIMPNGLTISQINKSLEKRTEEIYREAFSKGIPKLYWDERSGPANEYVRANPDGSEDLILYDIDTMTCKVLKSLLPPGKDIGHI